MVLTLNVRDKCIYFEFTPECQLIRFTNREGMKIKTIVTRTMQEYIKAVNNSSSSLLQYFRYYTILKLNRLKKKKQQKYPRIDKKIKQGVKRMRIMEQFVCQQLLFKVINKVSR